VCVLSCEAFRVSNVNNSKNNKVRKINPMYRLNLII